MSKWSTRGRVGTDASLVVHTNTRPRSARTAEPRRPDRVLACERMERLRTLSEAECYERCYGWRYTEDTVKLLPRRGAAAPVERDDFAERLRMLLEQRLDAREAEAA
jgi:hypothetical protein